MRDYWLTQSLLQAVGIGFGLLALTGLVLALWLPKKWWGKLLGVTVVVFLISIPVRKAMQEQATQQVKADDYKERYAKAKALFDERCKTAGEKIYRTVENVEGVFLMKLRKNGINFSDQYALDDPYGSDYYGDAYPASMLWGKSESYEWFGYKFVALKDTPNSPITKYTLGARKQNGEPEILKNIIADLPQFGITYEDISSRSDRDSWIAGSKLQIVDTKTGELLAERIGWMFDSALGDTSGGRQPWSYAAYNACPAFPKLHDRYPIQEGQASIFSRKIVKPSQGK